MGYKLTLEIVSIMLTIDLSKQEAFIYEEPLAMSNCEKSVAVDALLAQEDWEEILHQALCKDRSFLIGIRVRSTVDKEYLFAKGQRGIITDIHYCDGIFFTCVTWDNLPKSGLSPEQRTVRFSAAKLWKYCENSH